MAPDGLEQLYHRTRWTLLVRGLIALALGVFIFARPLESVAAFALVIAIWALVTGVILVADGLAMHDALPHWWLLALSGVVSVIFGVAALYYYPALSLVFAVAWVAYWLLASGFFGIYAAMMERRLGMAWAWTLAFGVLSVVAGVYAIAVPPATLTVIMALLSVFAIIGGVVLLIGYFKVGAARAHLGEVAARART